MMPERPESSREIADAAALWVARLDRAPLSAAEEQAFELWLDGDIRCRGAFAIASSVLAQADRAGRLPLEGEAAGAEAAPRMRRRVLMGGAAVAATLAAALFAGRTALAPPMLLKTARGEIRHLPLPDGSSVTLNTDSVLRVAYSSSKRDVDLVSGEVLFDVAKDHQRPFIVRAGDVTVQAIGTSFTVRLDEGGKVRVLVKEGVVEVVRKGQARPVRAAANVLATVQPLAESSLATEVVATRTVAPNEVARGLAWRDGLLSFDGESLAEAAAEFERYSTTRIIVDDDALARETVTGLFSASDPRGFAKAVATAFDGRVRLAGDEVHISR